MPIPTPTAWREGSLTGLCRGSLRGTHGRILLKQKLQRADAVVLVRVAHPIEVKEAAQVGERGVEHGADVSRCQIVRVLGLRAGHETVVDGRADGGAPLADDPLE